MTQLPPDSNPTPIQVFENAGISLRVVMRDGEPWFVAADVCRALAIGNVADAVGRLDDDEKGVDSVDTPGGKQRASVVSESGLYSLILGSRKPEARAFQRWVTHDVLPSIRRTGSYGSGDVMAVLADPAQLRGLLSTYAEKVLELQPKADGYDRLVSAPDTFGFQEACKVIHRQTGSNQNQVRSAMFERGWIRRLDGKLAPAHYGMAHGYVTSRVREWRGENGETRSKPELRITGKGVDRLIEALMVEVAS